MIRELYLSKDVKNISDRSEVHNPGCILQYARFFLAFGEAKKISVPRIPLQPLRSEYLRGEAWPWAFVKPGLRDSVPVD